MWIVLHEEAWGPFESYEDAHAWGKSKQLEGVWEVMPVRSISTWTD